MKKVLYVIGILLFAVTLVNPAAAGVPAPVQNDDPPPAWVDAKSSLFLPVVNNMTPTYHVVSGQVKDANDQPLSGVTVSADAGPSTLTDANGIYSLRVPEGERQVSATIAGKNFDPAPAWLNLKQDQHNVNFSAGMACTTPTPNPSFETVFYWNPISGSAAGYTPWYSNTRANTGTWSGYTGIWVGGANVESWSRWRSHEIYIPYNATSATVSMFLYPLTQEAVLARGEAAELSGPDADAPDLKGMNTDVPKAPDAIDAQYVIVTDIYNNWLETLVWTRRNDQTWLSTVPLSLLNWRGRAIKLEFGTFNDGYGGVTSAYFDDVVVTVCDDTTTTTCTTTTNLLVNSDFETVDTGWTISPAVYPSTYTTDFFYSSTHSMLSGTPIASAARPGWTTGEFYQYVTIPITVTSATLKVRLLPRSTDGWGYKIEEQAALDAQIAAKGNAPLVAESQYGYLCAAGYCGPNPITLAPLFRWYPIDSAYGLYREFDLTAWRGQSFGIVFGAMDYGDLGNTALYVDDVFLDVCIP